jgi:hypothetical protein
MGNSDLMGACTTRVQLQKYGSIRGFEPFMPSPFPGIDPFLEAPGIFPDMTD